MRSAVIPLSIGLVLLGTLASQGGSAPEDRETLRQYADKINFRIGTLYERQGAQTEPEYNATVARDYNSLISTVFWKAMQPEQGQYNFRAMDNDM